MTSIDECKGCEKRGNRQFHCPYHSGFLDGVESASETTDELRQRLEDTLTCLKEHINADTLRANLKHADSLCPCWQNEVRRAEATLAKVRGTQHFNASPSTRQKPRPD